ncbi:hypothetical protein DERP_014476 [Dermatophagoides pteronyssinus]|uniref:Uncharacterized protein n=1 Tax=Dermatophagoides pteronyssinus TaxID=6956 RepID=A0ABQ8IUH2_DERPT|nr:hypothetical protein DERP_014476 [Dermatophagoides pteronyssinus]
MEKIQFDISIDCNWQLSSSQLITITFIQVGKDSHRSGHSIRFKDNLLDKSHNGKERKNLPKKSKKKQSPSKPKQKNKLKLNNNNNNKIDAKENYLTTMMTTKMTTEELGQDFLDEKQRKI